MTTEIFQLLNNWNMFQQFSFLITQSLSASSTAKEKELKRAKGGFFFPQVKELEYRNETETQKGFGEKGFWAGIHLQPRGKPSWRI